MTGKNLAFDEIRTQLVNEGVIKEQPMAGPGYETATNTAGTPRPNLAADTEEELEISDKPKEDKQQAYRVSGGVLVMHGKTKGDLEITTEEKKAYQETMDEFVNEVSDLSDFGILNVYKNSVEWSGKIIEFDLEFFFSIGEENGVYINSEMMKIDPQSLELLNKLSGYYQKFKSKWA